MMIHTLFIDDVFLELFMTMVDDAILLNVDNDAAVDVAAAVDNDAPAQVDNHQD